MGPVEVNEWPQPAFLACSRELGHRFGISATGVEGNQRLTRFAVAHQLQSPEDTQPPYLTDGGVPFGKRAQLRADDVGPQRTSVLDDAFFAEDVDRGHGGGTRQGVT